jgi:hypothetical protein
VLIAGSRRADSHCVTESLSFPARVGSENSVLQAEGAIEITSYEVAILRHGQVLGRSSCATVRARRTRTSFGSALRIRVNGRNFAVDFSVADAKFRWLPLELAFPPVALMRQVRAGRRAARELLDLLRARGADAR